MTQQQVALTPAQQQENAVINDIAQYVGAKWGRPAVVVLFQDRQSAAFRSLTANDVSEGQFIIAGEEMLAMGRRIQTARLEQQFKVNVVQQR